MASINYRVNEKSKGNFVMIYIRFKNGSEFDLEVSSKIQVKKRHWSSTKQCVKPSPDAEDYRDNVNTQLKELENHIFSQFTKDNHNGLSINKKWLQDIISSFHNKPIDTDNDKEIYLTVFADYFSENAKNRTNYRTGKPLDIRTIQDYINAENKLKAYETIIGRKIRLTEVDFAFHEKFIIYLRKTENLGENTIGGIIDNLKAFLRNADASGFNVNPSYKSRKFISPFNKTEDIYLNRTEIKKIKNFNFEFNSYLDNARDWLIIGVWTGLRVSDLLTLTKKDITDGFIDNENLKTGTPVAIPLHYHVIDILDKRFGNFPRKISNQNFNEYIKIVAAKVGITEQTYGGKMMKQKDGNNNDIFRKVYGDYPKYELVTSHICRRSFATNLYGKIDTLTIMRITGHATEKQFLQYIKITPREHASRMKDLFDEEFKKEQNEIN